MASAQTKQMQALLKAKQSGTYNTSKPKQVSGSPVYVKPTAPKPPTLPAIGSKANFTPGLATGISASNSKPKPTTVSAPAKTPTYASASATTIGRGASDPTYYAPGSLGNQKVGNNSGGGGGGYTPSRNSSPQAPQSSQQAPQVQETTPPDWIPTDTTGKPADGLGGGGVAQAYANTRNDFANASLEDRATMAAMMEGMLSYIDQMGGDLTNQIRSQMGMDDPETANAIAMIRREADMLHKEMLEDLNSKGLVQSGIYAEAKSRLAESQGMNVSNFVAQRFGDLQGQLNSAMMNIGQMRTQAMSSNMGMVNQNLMNDRTQQAQMGMQNLSNQITTRGQDMQQNQWNQTFDWQKSTDNRDFGYTQQRDAVGDSQFGQSLAASRASGGSGSGNSLGWAQFNAEMGASQRYDQQESYNAGNQFVADYGHPTNSQEYQQVMARINANPMFQDPQTKDYIISQIVKPQTAPPRGNSNLAPMSKFYTPGYSNPYQKR